MSRDPHLSTSRSIRLHTPFNTAGVLEVCMKGVWYRTTSTRVRSFSGARRLSAPTRVEHGQAQIHIPITTRRYQGPVYAMGTNFQYLGPVLHGFVTREQLNGESIESI